MWFHSLIPIVWNRMLCYQKYWIRYWTDPIIVFFSSNHWWLCLFYFYFLTGSQNLLLLVASQDKIIADNITSEIHNIYSLVQDASYVVALDFDSVTGRVFWSDLNQGKTWSAFQNGTDKRVVSRHFWRPPAPLFETVVILQWETTLPPLPLQDSLPVHVLNASIISKGLTMSLSSVSHEAEACVFHKWKEFGSWSLIIMLPLPLRTWVHYCWHFIEMLLS